MRINALVAKAQKTPDEGWTMADGTPWPGNNSRDHPGMIQVFLGNTGAYDIDGNELPRLVYVSREKRPGYQHHKKAGAENALVCLYFKTWVSFSLLLLPETDDCFLRFPDKSVCCSHKCTIYTQS